MGNNKIDSKVILQFLKTAIIQISTVIILMIIFSLCMNFFEIEYKYSAIFGSVAVGIGAFVSAYYLSRYKKQKGYFYGSIVGIISFIIVTIVGLILNNGSITINTLFHFIIFTLCGIIGGILGVNKKSDKYI